MPGTVEFVGRGGDITTDSLAFPNQYALGEYPMPRFKLSRPVE